MFERDQTGPDEQAEERDEQGQMVQAAGLLADDVALPEGFQEKSFGPFRDVVDAGGGRAEPDTIPPRVGQDQRRAEERREQEQVHDDFTRQRDVPQNLPGDLLHTCPPVARFLCQLWVPVASVPGTTSAGTNGRTCGGGQT